MAIEAEALRALSEKATEGNLTATDYGNGHEDRAFIMALWNAYRSGSLIHRSALAEDAARAVEEIKNLSELADAADWLISCHERIQSAVPVRDLPEATAAYKSALTRVSFATLPLTKEAAR